MIIPKEESSPMKSFGLSRFKGFQKEGFEAIRGGMWKLKNKVKSKMNTVLGKRAYTFTQNILLSCTSGKFVQGENDARFHPRRNGTAFLADYSTGSKPPGEEILEQ